MFQLIENEFVKIFKRKNIYILLIIAIIIITGYNLFQKIISPNIDISEAYKQAYKQDMFYLVNYEDLTITEKYSNIEERVKLEKYAIENNIRYNILLNSENKNITLPSDARINFMKVFNNFDIIIIFFIIYIGSTILSEEYNTGTIKGLLIKPHKRVDILFSKLITSILIFLVITMCIIIFQYILGGLLFGFDSYSLEAIRYDRITQDINTMNLYYYMALILLCKIPMYLIINLIILLIGTITNNIAINILTSLGIYLLPKIEFILNDVSKYLVIYNWDLSNFLFGEMIHVSNELIQPCIISVISIIIFFVLLIIAFKNKEIENI